MTADNTPAKRSSEAAENIQVLNHLTRSERAGWEYPGDAYSTIANLALLANRLPQALEQIRQFVTDMGDAGHLRRDDGGDLDNSLRELRLSLDAAALAASALGKGLDIAHSALGPIAYQENAPTEDHDRP